MLLLKEEIYLFIAYAILFFFYLKNTIMGGYIGNYGWYFAWKITFTLFNMGTHIDHWYNIGCLKEVLLFSGLLGLPTYLLQSCEFVCAYIVHFFYQ